MSGFKEVVGHCRYSCHVGTAIHVSRLILKTISSYLLLCLSFLLNPGPALNVLPTPYFCLSIFQGFESPINRMWRPPHFSVWLYLCLKQVIQLPWGCSSFTLVVENRKYKPWLETEAFIPLLFFFFFALIAHSLSPLTSQR